MSLQDRFLTSLRQTGLIPAGSRVLVAVSGGADSVALLYLLHDLAKEMKLSLRAAHLDHALRDDSLEDARFVAELCANLHVPLTVERHDVAATARQRKGNLEEVAREIRRRFLLTVADKHGCDLIALGHHANDQAETVLMRLLRGAGTSGLSGMRVVHDRVVRPLLPFYRSEILEYLEAKQLDWREDASNRDQGFTRNRIRHQLLPLLADEYNPNIVSQLVRLAGQMRQDEDFWAVSVDQHLASFAQWQDGACSLERTALLSLAPSLASRVVRAALLRVRGDLRGISAEHVEAVLALAANSRPQAELHLPGSWVAVRYDRLLLNRDEPRLPDEFSMLISEPGVYQLPDGRKLSLELGEQSHGENCGTVEFAARSLTLPLMLRYCRPGDRVRPSGMKGTKKLQDLFVDLKLPMEERRRALVVLSTDDILWVVGVRRAEGWRPEAGQDVLRLVLEA